MTNIGFQLTTSDDLTKLAQELRDFQPKFYRTLAREVIPEIDRALAKKVDSDLRPYPRPAVHPFVWSLDPVKNARGRRGFFARYPNGYTRTGQLGRDWYSDIVLNNGLVSIEVGNKNAGASWVYGSETFDFLQVPGHETTGWQNAGKAVPDIVIGATLELESGIETAVDTTMRRIFK